MTETEKELIALRLWKEDALEAIVKRLATRRKVMSDKVMQSYVWHEGKCFFVSTINRESSAAMAYNHIYAETMVWDYDYDKRERGSLTWQEEDIKGGISMHLLACKNLHDFGEIRDDEDA